MNAAHVPANRQIARAAGVVMAGFVLSNVAGLVRQVLVLRVFGTQREIDAFNAAARVPETLFVLVAGGALASAFIPVFTGFLEKDDRAGAWQLASGVMNLVFLVLAGVSALAAVFAPHLVQLVLAREFDPESQALTVELLRILLVSPAIFGVSGLLMGILNTHRHFLLPALAPTFHWIGWIIGVLWFVPTAGIHGLAYGAVLGAGLHLLVQLPGLRGLRGVRYTPTFASGLPAVRKVAALMGPRVFGTAVVQLNFWVNVIMATGMPEGSLTALGTAFAVMTMPQVVIAQAIAIAALPTFSAQAARGQFGEMRSSLAATLRGVLLLSFPAAVGLILLRFPLVRLLFEYGEFTERSTELVAWALLWYTAGLVSHSVVEIVSRAFYALHDTRTPVFIGAATMALNVVLSLGLAAWFERSGWMPHGGLALANTLATTLEMFVLIALMRRRLGGLEGRRILAGLSQAVLGTMVMAVALAAWLAAAGNLWLQVSGVLAGGAVYALILWILRVEEVRGAVEAVFGRIRRL
ncbi:MAG TPA: murein biosynthesis integral membrane protein MurJ [Anaerolineales bacterium]|nr:murein biosynthesis integral membrane protein MurJ [Anaerolineales bacterium]